MLGKKILVADDETHILSVVTLKLCNAGFRVITARDGREAYRLASEDVPDLIITDYQMPLLNGVEFCTLLRKQATTQNIPAILLTAHGFDLEEATKEAAGIQVTLSKPFSPRQLLQTVCEILGQRPGNAVSGVAA
jgi:two-component system, OmpR family, alkaline phosphatase synthesis response regulator PhoP